MDKVKKYLSILLYKVTGYLRSTYKLYWLVCILTTAFGIVMVMSATRESSYGSSQVKTQIIACVIGYIGAFILSNIDYERLGELWPIVVAVSMGIQMLTFTSLGHGAAGTDGLADDKAWITIPIAGVNFQPSELLKIGFIITFAYHLSKVVRAGKFDSLGHLLLLVLHALIPVGVVYQTGDQGSALIFVFMFAFIIIGAGIKWYYLLMGAGATAAIIPIVWKTMSEFQRRRFLAVYSPREGDELRFLYQQNLSKMAIGSGELTGRGLFNGPMVASGRNSADHNDFIFAVIGEELGFIGAVAAILLLFSIMILTLKVAYDSSDEMGRYICLGYFSIIATQTILNIGMCVGVLPVIGITLPFFSAGGSSTMCLYFGFGLVQSVYMRRKETNLRVLI